MMKPTLYSRTSKRLLASVGAAAALVAGVAAGPALAGSDNPGEWHFSLEGNRQKAWSFNFYSGEEARVEVRGNGDVDVEIVDEFGTVVASDRSSSWQAVATFTPRRSKNFTVKVINSTGGTIDYILNVN
jgi:hypothetical protein